MHRKTKPLPFLILPLFALFACHTASPAAPAAPMPKGAKGAQATPAADAAWAVRGTWTDACCCKVACPCLFGTGPTEGFCEGASWFQIESGHHGGVDLDGLSAVVAYRVKGWTRIVVDDSASPEQVAAFGGLIPKLLRFVQKGPAPSVASGALELAREGDTIRYATDETAVEIALVESATGEPIVLQNLPAKGTPFPVSHGHTQYMSRKLKHSSPDGSYEWSGRNGFASRIDLTSSGS